MQATVLSHDPDDGTVLVTDAGRRLPAAPDVIDPALRRLRPGQRLSVEVDGDGHVVRAWLPGLGDGPA